MKVDFYRFQASEEMILSALRSAENPLGRRELADAICEEQGIEVSIASLLGNTNETHLPELRSSVKNLKKCPLQRLLNSGQVVYVPPSGFAVASAEDKLQTFCDQCEDDLPPGSLKCPVCGLSAVSSEDEANAAYDSDDTLSPTSND